ncbi:hypothetical protein [Tenacibaculum piscium]|uniref:hypothetical protein n=1 Tax=Tenacibaculum piscium TaxID=1458515 RepID=UPI001EFAD9DB|nr:hypothetical protein [Tenacibaculum piscium]MCG8182722.1 hypothetical protein [Tenacibaculum piscium]MCG8204114.1 hypothetical protein [Tenacibaculum piscium]
MKHLPLLLLLITCKILVYGQTKIERKNGKLITNISPTDIAKFKADGFVHYSDFGATGDGKTDDIDNISATHKFANEHNLSVKADDGATYYISGKKRPINILTNTDFGAADFIIDDTEVKDIKSSIFLISSKLKRFKLEGISSLKKNQKKIDTTLLQNCLVTVKNSNVKHYIRNGANENNGASQTDIFLVKKNGTIDINTPIIWDFNKITKITALPIDEKPLKITGGCFITIANKAESKYTYYSRNIIIRRSNVIVDGLEHKIIGEGSHGAPYSGFISIRDCANVTVKNTTLSGHKTYRTINSNGKASSMGSYDILVTRALNVSFINCTQTNDINDKKYWGIMGSNYCKNLIYDNCTLSRFDAHMGVANATIRNSTLGHTGISVIGTGILTIENSTIYGKNLVNLRSDYGSTWQGEIIIRNTVFKPRKDKASNISLIGGKNYGKHNFGYTCYMPKRITIENLYIDDSNYTKDYEGIHIFSDFNPKISNLFFEEKFHYIRTKKVFLKNVTIASGKTLKISDNKTMFKKVKIKYRK